MKKLTQEELKDILEMHKLWLDTEGIEGAKANLEGANLKDANLRGANLEGTNLEGTNLKGVIK
jgi:uncharacterized protein YjbI with pentapeptide repeats